MGFVNEEVPALYKAKLAGHKSPLWHQALDLSMWTANQDAHAFLIYAGRDRDDNTRLYFLFGLYDVLYYVRVVETIRPAAGGGQAYTYSKFSITAADHRSFDDGPCRALTCEALKVFAGFYGVMPAQSVYCDF
ncbi:hypothetical protein ANK1_3913 [plant metagenome]|uniref:Uncharacterized protein n=1 Tax=plant metagenome TaxID=1297885 RepID=A0A484PYZ6_9ZZZZ